ncbi:MAG: LPS-assembly protein LptD, partial [Acidobacteria bacterium]|nr:LPS-assembly protein LptD [Acidobacteriota bacterium]
MAGHRSRRAFLCWLALAAACRAAAAQAPAPPAPAKTEALSLEGIASVRTDHYAASATEVRLWGYVDISMGDASIQADEVIYRKADKVVEAKGNVVLMFPGAVLAGTRLVYHTDSQTGEIEDAVGYLEQDNAILRARRAARVGPDRIRVERAVFTTCTQPTPYWSFRIRRGTFDLGEYAYLSGVSFRTYNVPIFYTPYLVWPIKTRRASGLLFPEFSTSDKLGKSISVPYFWVFSDNADVTLFFDGHSKAGAALGTELNWLPTWRGRVAANSYWINDQVRDMVRYRYEWKQREELPFDFKLHAHLQGVSDFAYFTDFETDLNRAAQPQTVSVADATRQWSWYSFSIRARQQDQYFVSGLSPFRELTSKVTNVQMPEIELRGRAQRLGHTPLYLSFESSISGFRKRILTGPDEKIDRDSDGTVDFVTRSAVDDEDELVSRVDNLWGRLDLAPRLQMPLLKSAWADVSVEAGWRGTLYSARPNQEPTNDEFEAQDIVSDAVFRNLWATALNLTGPRFQRVFATPGWGYSPKLKHVLEPFARYEWRPESSTRSDEIIVADEIDSIPQELSDVSYGLRQRFYALRPPETGRPLGVSSAEKVSFEGLEEQSEEEQNRTQKENGRAEEQPLEVSQALGPVELGSIEISQRYSFVRSLTTEVGLFRDTSTGDPVTRTVGFSNASPVTLRLRFNPSHEHVVDASYEYDPTNDVLTQSSVSATLGFGSDGYFRGSWFHGRSADPLVDPSSFLRTQWGFLAWERRLALETEWDYDLERGNLDHQLYRLRYSSQCCGIHLGYDLRDFEGNSRREVSLRIDLGGIGKIIDLRRQL